ncbi:transcriptional regulator [Billgrantia azerbaijanica]|nr:transcriptional regulator [Halomonas azerbaijanica]
MPDTSQLDIDEMRVAAASATALLRALAHEDRLLLLCQLSQEELCVGDLEARLDIRQPSLSQQLGVLRRQGLVSTRREGKHIFYRIADDKALGLLQVLYAQFCAGADTGAQPDTETAASSTE